MNSTTLSIPVQVDGNETAATAYAESLKIILKHVADFHITVVEIISQKYNISVDEIMKTVTSDSRYTNMLVDPKIHELTSSSNVVETAPVSASAPLPAPVKKTTIKTSEKKIKIKPKPAVLLPETNATSC